MKTRLITLAFAMATLAGCGGAQDAPEAEQTPDPTPRVYTLKELKAALPSADEVEGGLKVNFRCPQDKDRCGGTYESSASVLIDTKAATPELTERQADQSLNAVHVLVQLDADEATAESDQVQRRKDLIKYDGEFDIPRQEFGEGQYLPAEKGRGELSEASRGLFKGFRLDRTTIRGEAPMYTSILDVRSGTATVKVTALVGAEGREAGDAKQLADQVLADLLQRLG